MSEPVQFPLAAVVGADDLKLALCLTAIDPKIGGVLIEHAPFAGGACRGGHLLGARMTAEPVSLRGRHVDAALQHRQGTPRAG